MPSTAIPDSASKQRYPLTLPDLSRTNLTLLIEVLTTGRPQDISPSYSKEIGDQIQKSIKKLPSELRKRFSVLLLPSAFVPVPTTLCTTHRGLNPCIISDICRLLRLEVEDHLAQVEKWNQEPLDPRAEDALLCLRSLRGLWTDFTSHPDEKRVNYQQNKCDACIISRIITDPKYLENLRAALQSRTRTRCKHRVPKLSRLIEQALGRFDFGALQQIFKASSEIGMSLKQVRKNAAREKHLHARACKRVCMNGKGEGDEASKDEDANQPQREIIPSKEPSNNDTPNQNRRPSSMTVFFCAAPELKHSRRTQDDLQGLDEDAAQDQLIYDIINAYNTCIPEDGDADIMDPDLPEIQPLLNNPPQDASYLDSLTKRREYGYDWTGISRLAASSGESDSEGDNRRGRPVDEMSDNGDSLLPHHDGRAGSSGSGRDSSGRREVCRVTVEVYSESDYSASYSFDEDETVGNWKARTRETRWSLLWNEVEPKYKDSE
ncbi:hypothetical protein BDV12DRAFT_167276 [Aspergillus spectabilis]